MLDLRPYQANCIQAIHEYMAETGGNPLASVPTGGGKSLIIARFCMDALAAWPNTRIGVIAHVPELIQQNHAELMEAWPDAPAGIYSAKLGKRQLGRKIMFGGIQSIYRRAYEIGHLDVLLIDEAHLIPRKGDTMYRKFISDMMKINPNLKVIGFTATPFRTDSGMLHKGEGAMFDELVYEANLRDLIDQGFLSRLITPPPGQKLAQIDTEGVGTVAGEFNAKQLEAKATDPETVRRIVDDIVQWGGSRRGWLVFGSGVAHAEMLCAEVRSRGVSAETIFGNTPAFERRNIIKRFKGRDIRCLCSVGVLTTGFNAKHVDLVALGRPTKSTGLYIQMIGRGTRLSPGKDDCMVLDFGGNIERHGPVDAPYPKEEKKKKEDQEPRQMTKECPACKALNGIAARQCADCGYQFPEVFSIVSQEASTADVMSSGHAMVPTWVDVDAVEYVRHQKAGSPDSIRVVYRCGLLTHREWVCIEHQGKARNMAVSWWRRRAETGSSIPQTIGEALEIAPTLAVPRQIAVRPAGRYTEIVGHRYFEPDHMRVEAA